MEQTDEQLTTTLVEVPKKHEDRVHYKNQLMAWLLNIVHSKQTKLKGTSDQYVRGDGSYVTIPPELSHTASGSSGPSEYNPLTGELNIPDYSIKQPLTLATFFTNVSLPANSNTDFYSVNLPTNILKNNGDFIELEYVLDYTSVTFQSPFLQLYFGGTTLLNRNITGNGIYQQVITSKIIRVNNTTIRHYTYLGFPDTRTGYAEVSGLSLSNTPYAIKGVFNGTSSVSGTARMGVVKLFRAA